MTKIMSFIDGFKEGQKIFGETIAIIVNSILLGLVYFFGVGLTSIVSKIFGRKFLDLKPENKETYWEDLNLDKKKMEEYYKQF